ncbi:MAG: alpha/beta hydrolase fold domain-containing protein, partial [Gemmataceae bacterium]
MPRRWIVAGGLAGVACLVWAFVAAREPAPATRVEADVTFAQPAGATLRLDLTLPAAGDGPFPAVVCLHGGGWVGGSRKQMAQTLEVLARRGFVAAAPDYRLAPSHR